MHVRIYTDGGSRGNPGPSASGAVIKELRGDTEGRIVAEISEYIGETTNNQAEYRAIIFGLEHARDLGARQVEVVMDSELAVKQLTGKYRVRNADLAERYYDIQKLLPFFAKVSFRHVRRELNKEADALVNKALDRVTGKKKR